MDLGSKKRKKVFDSSMIRSKKINMGVGSVSKSSIQGRQRNLVLGSRIDFDASGSFLAAINDHAESSDHNRDCWIMDSGANTHVSNDPKWLLNPVDLTDVKIHTRLADGKKVRIESFRVYLKFNQGSFIIRRVACVTKLNMSVISMAKLHEEGCKALFDDHVTIMRENITLSVGMEKQRLYELSPGLSDLELMRLPSLSSNI